MCELVYTLCEKKKMDDEDELSCRWYLAALNVSGKIAFAYAPEDIQRFIEWMPAAQKYAGETMFWA